MASQLACALRRVATEIDDDEEETEESQETSELPTPPRYNLQEYSVMEKDILDGMEGVAKNPDPVIRDYFVSFLFDLHQEGL